MNVKIWEEENIDFSSCVDVMKKFASRIKKAANIERQVKRVESFQKINEKKVLKVKCYLEKYPCPYYFFQKGNFNKTLSILTSALGGNISNPQCSKEGFSFKGNILNQFPY